MASEGPFSSVGSQRLDRWLLARKGRSQGALARELVVSKSLVSRWRRGLKRPLLHASRIERATGIPPAAWLKPPKS